MRQRRQRYRSCDPTVPCLGAPCMRGPRPFRIFLMVILALTPFAQSFWFLRAWRVIDALAWLGLLDLLGVRVILRRALGPWGRAVARLWLIASCLGFLAVAGVGGVEWLSRPVM